MTVQLPQWFGSVPSVTQTPLQRVCEAGQQLLFAQVRPAGHTLPQLPQLLLSLVASTHAAGSTEGHAVSAPLHVKEQAFPMQAAAPLSGAAVHALPQALQLAGSLDSSVHAPPQHAGEVPAVHAVVQPPQWVGSVVSFTQPVPAQ
jgi:hypothetical protein